MKTNEQTSVSFEYIRDHCATIGDVLKLIEGIKSE
jgi:hypothetical protein